MSPGVFWVFTYQAVPPAVLEQASVACHRTETPPRTAGRGAHTGPQGACLSLTEPDTIDAVSVYSTKEPAAKHWQKSKVADYT